MTMIIYKSTDASAPTLQGIVGGSYSSGWADGSLVQLFRKCLVTGYGSGAQSAGAGWTQAYQGTSEGVFQMGGGNQRFLHVLDDGSVTAGAKEALVNGFGAMSAIATGTDQFPDTSQNSGKLYMRKSDTADTTQRSWIMFADNKTFYFFSYPGFSTAYYAGMMFGDFYSYVSGDVWNTAIIARETSASTDAPTTNEVLANMGVTTNATRTGHYMPRSYAQTRSSGAGTGAINFNKIGTFIINATTNPSDAGVNTGLPYPNPSDGKLWLSRAYVVDHTTPPTDSIRGFLRGFWIPQSAGSTLPLEYTVGGSGALSGRTFRTLGLRSAANVNGRFVMETSDTWD